MVVNANLLIVFFSNLLKIPSKPTLAICSLSLCLQTPSRVKLNDTVFKNIRGTASSQVAVNLLCSKDVPCQNVLTQRYKLGI